MKVSHSKTSLGALGGRMSNFSLLKYKTLFLVVIIGLSLNCVYSYIFRRIITRSGQCDIFVGKNDHGNHAFNRLFFGG